MILEVLSTKNVLKIKDKKIFCYEKSISYLDELNNDFPDLVENIAGIFDDFKRNQGDFNYLGFNIGVIPSKELRNVDWDNSVIVITSDYFKEAFEKIVNIFETETKKDSEFKYPEEIYFFANKETKIDLSYRKIYEKEALENLIFFRSGPHQSSYVKGMDFSDNARALFEYMLANGYNERYKLVWAVKNPNDFVDYLKYPNVSFVSFDWSTTNDKNEQEAYYKALCLAKYIFFTDAYGFARNCRKDQTRIQLWHGCGFKTRTNFVPCEHRYEYNIVISDTYKKIHSRIYGLRENQVLVTGYPKADWLFNPISHEKLCELGISAASHLIFWMPTFRIAKESLSQLDEHTLSSDTGLPIVASGQMLIEVNELLKQNNAIMVIKLHPFQDRESICCSQLSNIVLLDNEQLVEHDIQINQLLGWADALISDYSSVAVDYLLLNRPMAFTLDDVDEYESSRGFVFENIRDWLPGKEIFDFSDFKEFLEELFCNIDSTEVKRNSLRNIMHKYLDDKSCKRTLDMLGIK